MHLLFHSTLGRQDIHHHQMAQGINNETTGASGKWQCATWYSLQHALIFWHQHLSHLSEFLPTDFQ